MTIRWLHLSDVHECDREGYHRTAMYDEIVAEVAKRPAPPDFVFFTGDLAFAGAAKEYESLGTRFLDRLKAALPDGCPIFMVPGNHDVDRKAAVPPRLWMDDEAQQKLFQEVGSGGSRKRGETLLPRFAAYQAFEQTAASWGQDWLGSDSGSICQIFEVRGSKIAIAGINTAWLCQDDDDWGKLTAGRTMVDAALRQAAKSDPKLVIVLGHHPLASMSGEQPWSDGRRIHQRLEQANALYLHGHLHASGSQRIGDSLQSVLAIQAPSAFQAGDDKIWRNGIMWGEADLDGGWLVIEPLKWNDGFREYKFDSDAGANDDRVPGRDAFRLRLPGRRAAVGHPDATAIENDFNSNLPDWQAALSSVELRAALTDFKHNPELNSLELVPFNEDLPHFPAGLLSANHANKLEALAEACTSLALDLKEDAPNVPKALARDLQRYAKQVGNGPELANPRLLRIYGAAVTRARDNTETMQGLGSYLAGKLSDIVDEHVKLMADYRSSVEASIESAVDLPLTTDATPEAVAETLDQIAIHLPDVEQGDLPAPPAELQELLRNQAADLRETGRQVDGVWDAMDRAMLERRLHQTSISALSTIGRYAVVTAFIAATIVAPVPTIASTVTSFSFARSIDHLFPDSISPYLRRVINWLFMRKPDRT